MKRSLVSLGILILLSNLSLAQTPYFSALRVKDIDSAITWYSSVFNLELHNRVDNGERGFKQANLRNGKMLIELVELQEMVTPVEALKTFSQKAQITGMYKIGFAIDNVDSWHDRLEKLNVEFYGDIVTDVVSGNKTFLIKDPDGNVLQFFEK